MFLEMIDNSKEYILCAAIKRINPKPPTCLRNNDIHLIEIGLRHPDIRDRFLGEVDMRDPAAQGFYTSKGRFVGRKEAMLIAYEAGQVPLKKVYLGNTGKILDLYSEDLY